MSALLKKKMKIAGGLRQKPFKMKIFSILWVNWSRNIFCRILIGKNQMKIDSTLRLFDHAFCTMLEIYRIIKSNNTKIFGTQIFCFFKRPRIMQQSNNQQKTILGSLIVIWSRDIIHLHILLHRKKFLCSKICKQIMFLDQMRDLIVKKI